MALSKQHAPVNDAQNEIGGNFHIFPFEMHKTKEIS